MRAISLVIVVFLAGCAQFPELDATLDANTRAAEYPSLIPLGPVLAAQGNPRLVEADVSSLEARIAGLEARAARLRAVVLDRPTRQRMAGGVSLQ